jgi:hypothetical protein
MKKRHHVRKNHSDNPTGQTPSENPTAAQIRAVDETPQKATPPESKSGRDAHGRFQAGNDGGPGRPKTAASDFTVDQLSAFITAAKNPYAAAMLMSGAPEMAEVAQDFPPHIVGAVERLQQLGALASDLLITRLRKRLEEER